MTDPTAEHTMTDAELRITREWLGLTGDALADILHIDPRRIRRWETGDRAIPDGIATEIRDLEAAAAADVANQVRQLQDGASSIFIPRTTTPDDHARPASWRRAVAARAREQVPGARVHYKPCPAHPSPDRTPHDRMR